MKVKTSELRGAALDWSVAVAINAEKIKVHNDKSLTVDEGHTLHCGCWSPSTDWSQGGPLIEEYGITVTYCLYDQSGYWIGNGVDAEDEDNNPVGETALIAACRAIVSAKLGDEVEVPNELL